MTAFRSLFLLAQVIIAAVYNHFHVETWMSSCIFLLSWAAKNFTKTKSILKFSRILAEGSYQVKT